MHYRKFLPPIILAVLGVGTLFAQPDNRPAGPPKDEGERLLNDMREIHETVLRLQATVHNTNDIVKLNCVNEKLVAVKALLNIGENTKNDLDDASDDGANSLLVQLQSTHDEAVRERDEAQACVKELIATSGTSSVKVTRPGMPDDPTVGPNPFTPTNSPLDIERPAFATPWY